MPWPGAMIKKELGQDLKIFEGRRIHAKQLEEGLKVLKPGLLFKYPD
jgi:hypothetical protein